MKDSSLLVSVVIPAYNAATTIAATLRSVQAQTHAHMEILVVDDGSTDDGPAIAQKFATDDPRIRLIRQANAGVAAARNNGWKQAKSDYIAFVDADDLWTADKIERQLAALLAAGPDAGLAYSWYVMIDAQDRVTYRGEGPRFSGKVLDTLITNNFIGNGSAALVRRTAIEAAGGFEPALRDADAQGCEDILFYCRVAERHTFAVVEDYQIGYRQLPDNMSSNLPRMLRSWIIVLDEMRRKYPEKAPIIQQGLKGYGQWVVRRAVHTRKPRSVLTLAAIIARQSPTLAVKLLFVEAPRTAIEMLRWKFAPPAPPSQATEPDTHPYSIGKVFA